MVLVALAGLACGAINAMAGGGSLVLFPALVATGMGTLAANVTNSVSTWPGYLGSSYGFREEILDQRHRLTRLAVATLLGSIVGCVLLLSTSTEAFDQVVPVLVLFAALLVAIQPFVARRVGEPVEASPWTRRVQVVAIFAASVYGGYFGAALGVVFLGVLSLTIPEGLRRLNGLKAAMSVVDSTVSLVIFGLFGPVQWAAVAIAAPATLIGGYAGAHLSRQVNENVLRIGVVVFSVGLAGYLAFT